MMWADPIHMIGNFDNGAVIGLDEEGFAYLDKADPKVCNEKKREEINKALKEMGFLDKKEKRIDAAYVHVTDACNLHCVGCYSYIDNRNTRKELSGKDIKTVLDSLKSAGTQKIVISGGEPFLRDDLKDICKYAKEDCGFKFLTVITNGTLNADQYYPVLPYLNQLNISVDGFDESSCFIGDKGIMPQVLDTVNCLKHLLDVNMIITLHKKNMKYMNEYNKLARNLGVRFSFSIFTVEESNTLYREYVMSDTDLIEIERILMELNIKASIEDIPIGGEAISCRSRWEAGNKLISIDAKGDVYPCHMLHRKEMILGNALEQEVRTIVFNENNQFQNLHVDNFEKCSECKYKYLCGGGCRGRSYLRYGKITNKDAYCTMILNYYKDLMSEVKKKLEGERIYEDSAGGGIN